MYLFLSFFLGILANCTSLIYPRPKFVERFDIATALNLNPYQLSIFNAHFAAYLVGKERADHDYMLNHPTTALMRRMPLIGQLVDAMETDVTLSNRVAEDFRAEAIKQTAR